MKRILSTTLLVGLAAGSAWPQAADSSQSGTNEPVVSGSSETPWLPNAVNGEAGSLSFASEAEQSNLLLGGLTLASSYDDNALSNNTTRIGNVALMLAPYISIKESRVRTLWTFNYSPGFTLNQRLPQRYDASHNLDFNFQYRITERFTARVHDNFVDSSTSFDRLNENPLLAGGNVLHQPNRSIITPLSTRIGNVANLDLIYQLGEETMMGASGNFSNLHYQNSADASRIQLFDTESGGADAFYSTRLSRRNSLGITYTFQKIAILGQAREHTKSHSALVFYTLDLKPGMTMSFFAGPDRTTTSDQFIFVLFPFLIPVSITHEKWFVDEGMTFGWQGQHTSARLSLIHHVTDGGGLVGAVRIYNGNAELRRQFSARWTGDVGLNYGDNDPLSSRFGNAFRAITGTAGLERTIAENWLIGIRYGRDHQNYQNGISASTRVLADHNRAWISVSYRFARPLGR